MLYNLLVPLADDYTIFNVFRYITFRSGAAVMTALVISFVLGPRVISWLKSKQGEGQPIREDGPAGHLLTKQGTPTMGGVLILLAILISTLLWADLTNGFVWAVLLVTVGFGLVGFADDYLKLTNRSSEGLPGRAKMIAQIAIAAVATYWISRLTPDGLATHLAVPFLKDLLIDLSWFFMPFAILVMVGASNAVNLTDGLDGLAIVPVMIAAGCFALIAYLVGNTVFASYLQLQQVPGSGELAVFCGALVGASLGFLWFNAPIIGGLFVLETVSVIVQVASFRMTGRRVFRMAPLHHHFEQKGWAEPTIVIRFWIIAMILALVGLSTLKLR
ncbi:MAG: phospho-N-acetylmuramoyl-pentapeptide-transferase [Alphaproteobacteria bacterium]